MEAIQVATPEQVRDFYRQYYRLGEKLPEGLAEISAAQPLTRDKAVKNASITMVIGSPDVHWRRALRC